MIENILFYDLFDSVSGKKDVSVIRDVVLEKCKIETIEKENGDEEIVEI